MEDNNKYFINDLHKTSTVEFKHKNETYNLNSVISMRYLEFFQKNKNKLSQKELAIECIVMNNKNFKIIIKELTRGEIFYIINKFFRKNSINYKNVNSYSDFYKVMNEYVNYCNGEISEQFKQIKERLAINMHPIIEWRKQINLLMKPQIEFFNKIKFPISDISKQIQELLQPIRDITIQFEKTKIGVYISKLNKLLIKLGYPPLDIELLDVHTIIENENSEEIYEIIDDIIIRNYGNDNIEKIFEAWGNYEFLKTRMRLFKDAMYAHKIGKYSLSIPLLLAELEGTIAEFCDIKGKSDMKEYKNYVSDILGKSKYSPDNEITKAYFMNNVLEGFFFGDKIPRFSRHAILHGADVNFDTKVNSINLIITLDIIFECMNSIKRYKD